MAGTKHSTRTTLLVVGFLAAGALHFLDVGDLSINQTAQAVPQVIEGGEFFTEALGTDCKEGSFCGKQVGFNGGCKARACCEKDETSCYITRSPAGLFPRVATATKGTCWSTSDPNDTLDWCTTVKCGDTHCGVGCTTAATAVTNTKRKPRNLLNVCPSVKK